MNPKRPTDAHFAVMKLGLDRGALRRVQILEATLECLGKHGIEKTTFEAIGKRLGIRKSHVAYHFPKLDSLVETAIRFVAVNAQQLTVERLQGVNEWKEQVSAVIDAAFDWARLYPHHVTVLYLFYYRCTFDRPSRRLNQDFRDVGAQRMAGILEPALPGRRQARARLRLAKQIQFLIFGGILDALSTEAGVSLGDANSWARDAAHALIAREIEPRKSAARK